MQHGTRFELYDAPPQRQRFHLDVRMPLECDVGYVGRLCQDAGVASLQPHETVKSDPTVVRVTRFLAGLPGPPELFEGRRNDSRVVDKTQIPFDIFTLVRQRDVIIEGLLGGCICGQVPRQGHAWSL